MKKEPESYCLVCGEPWKSSWHSNCELLGYPRQIQMSEQLSKETKKLYKIFTKQRLALNRKINTYNEKK